jgi:hypothetical protein
LIAKRDVGGTNYELFFQSTVNLGIYDGVSTKSAAMNWMGARSLACSFENGTKSKAYKDGAFVIDFSVANAITVNDAPILIGNRHTLVASQSNPIYGVIIYPEILPPTEILELEVYRQSRITPRKQWPGGGLRYPDRGDPYTPALGDPLFLDNIQSARVTLVDETSGLLSNTSYQIASGTWALREDATTGERYIECIVAGIISRRNLEAYGTWVLNIKRTAGVPRCGFISSNVEALGGGSKDGWDATLSSDDTARLLRYVAGASTTPLKSSVPGIYSLGDHDIVVTRSLAGEFHYYVDGSLVDPSSGGIGVNPFTDATITSSLYTIFDFDAGDRLYADRQFAGVLAP